jgi:hypothetical protein
VQRRPLQGQLTDAGGEREAEELGELGPDLPGVGVDRVAADEHDVEGALALTFAAWAHAIASRNTSSALGGPSVNTVTEPPLAAAASSTACDTARRQYGFISRSRPARRSRPSGPSSISSNAGICLTRAAMRMAVRA